MPTPEVGQIAPEFVLPDSSGGAWRLSDAVARCPQLLIFYRGHW